MQLWPEAAFGVGDGMRCRAPCATLSTKTIYKRFSKGRLRFATTTEIRLWNYSVWLFCAIFLSSRGMSRCKCRLIVDVEYWNADCPWQRRAHGEGARGSAGSGGQPSPLPVLFDVRSTLLHSVQVAGVVELDEVSGQSRSLSYSGSRSQKQNLELIYLAQNILAQQFAALDIFLCLAFFCCEFYNL